MVCRNEEPRPGLVVELRMTLQGKVVSGRGDFGTWIECLSHLYQSKTGMRFYPGTLNIQLERPYTLPRERIRLEAHEYGGRVSVNIVPCRILNRPAFLLRTDENESGSGHHPKTIIEVACDVRLRDACNLQDGDEVEVDVPS